MSRLLLLIITVIFTSIAYGKTAKSTVILLSIDGFSYEYLARYQPKNILKFAQTGIKAELLPVYPSKTFPNHLSIITGVYPAKHGIIHNKFYHPQLKQKYKLGAGKHDSAWLTAQPFWSYVQNNGLKSAVYFWPESDAKGQSSAPIYNIPYNTTDTIDMRFNQLITWLKLPKEQAPNLLLSYFSSVDSAGHEFGVNSSEVKSAITKIDDAFGIFLQRLNDEVEQDINIILLSDHGMVQLDQQKNIALSMVFSDAVQQLINDKKVVVANSSTQLYLYFENKALTENQQSLLISELIKRQKQHNELYDIHQNGDFPAHWQLNQNSAKVIPNIIINAKPSASFIQGDYAHNGKATHGYDVLDHNALTTIFLASGPDIEKGKVIAPFENIHIVPFMSELLGISSPANIDGKADILSEIIKDKSKVIVDDNKQLH